MQFDSRPTYCFILDAIGDSKEESNDFFIRKDGLQTT